jgi:hypothetical protein
MTAQQPKVDLLRYMITIEESIETSIRLRGLYVDKIINLRKQITDPCHFIEAARSLDNKEHSLSFIKLNRHFNKLLDELMQYEIYSELIIKVIELKSSIVIMRKEPRKNGRYNEELWINPFNKCVLEGKKFY